MAVSASGAPRQRANRPRGPSGQAPGGLLCFRLLKKDHLSAAGGLAPSRGAAAYEPSTPRTSHRAPPCIWAFLSSLSELGVSAL
jgi:hypothetical protein